jgi:hypothetical protein
MMRISGGSRAISQGAASTVQMTDAVLAKLVRQSALAETHAELAEVSHK